MRRVTNHAIIVLCIALAVSAPGRAAAPTPTPAPTPAPVPTAAPPETASEQQFVSSVSKDLQNRFGSTSQAAAAGYFRYTDEDQTGAISWVNTSDWQSDPQRPSQLRYDASGRLIGADFSVLQSGSQARPTVWGIAPARWIDFSPGHIHFAIKTPSGLQYGGAGDKSVAKVGGSLDHPTAADVVKIGTLAGWKRLGIPAPKTAADVAFAFAFPAVWVSPGVAGSEPVRCLRRA